MMVKWMGAVLVIAGCGGFGFSLASAHRREIQLLRSFRNCLQFMICELRYRLTPLPELCAFTAKEAEGVLSKMFSCIAYELEQQVSPEPSVCMNHALRRYRDQIPASLRRLLYRLGKSLGRFDLNGQLQGLEAICNACDDQLIQLTQNRDIRFRNYQTLGMCAGIALVILLI